ncbi:MAG: hydrogen peroxide-inducible genes activator [Bacteroidia bacterium]|jgi:LysR family hydrogen peroxide-inducible transcriptional activator|nr:hydrogen peroxide-inducible genes activator [Bacteroidia bacterium]|tara:strand:- start:2222 stop:3166 length:945 start_codon:yes stop_codon:yes gene_type:complete
MLNISLIQIQYLIALDEHRNFIKAAEACFVTQPTLSMQMKKLEDELGVLIFDRSKQPIMPTSIGSKIIHQARIIFRETGQIENILSDFRGDISGSLKIGILPTIANALIPKLIREISENHPNLKLTINEGLTKEIIDDLENDRLDVGIVSTPVKQNGLIERNLYTEKFRIYAHPDHPCYSKKAWEATDLLEDKLWLLSEGNCFRVQTINLCSLPDEKLNHLALTYESGSLQTLKKIADFEGGATIIPEWEASELDDDSLDNLRAFRADDAGRAVGLIYTKFYAKDLLINRLEEMIMNCLPRYVSENKNLKIIES